uniref:BTB domain-containing protein n=1 Tax=Panagrolaimus superbus TaxID=310955 RepID=A0A914Y639_9BILA
MECEIAADWIIDEKTLSEAEEYEYIESPRIQTTIPGVGYYIRIHPNENHDVYFHLRVNTNTNVDADYTFSIPSADFSLNKHSTYECDYIDENEVYAFSRKSLFESKNKYFRNGKLTFQLRGTLKCELCLIEQESLAQIFFKKEDKDFVIQVDDKEIKAHKLILRERSPVFAAMFDSGMKEAQESKVKIEGFSYDTVQMAINSCYDMEKLWYSTNDLLLLLKFSDVYDIAHFKNSVQQRLVMKLAPDNVCSIAHASVETNADKLRLCCMNYLLKCLKDSTAVSDLDFLDTEFKLELVTKAFCHKI